MALAKVLFKNFGFNKFNIYKREKERERGRAKTMSEKMYALRRLNVLFLEKVVAVLCKSWKLEYANYQVKYYIPKNNNIQHTTTTTTANNNLFLFSLEEKFPS